MHKSLRLTLPLAALVVVTLLAACGASPDATPTPALGQTAGAIATPTPGCDDYQRLRIGAGSLEMPGIVTAYRCGQLHVDSTAQGPTEPTELLIGPGGSLSFRFLSPKVPGSVEVRFYETQGVTATFGQWPEDVRDDVRVADQAVLAPSMLQHYAPVLTPGTYSIVVRAAWDGAIDVFFAQRLRVDG